MRPDRRPVGIEKIRAWPGTLSLDLEELARARDHDPADIRDNLLLRTRSLNPLWEDPVTMAVNAADGMLTDEDRASIRLLIVATESSVDQGKPISTWAQRFLRLPHNCRNFESKHACYGGTAALMMAAHWVVSGITDGKALVITTDQSRMHLHKPYEFTMGAGAAAMLVSTQPDVLELELGHNGYWTTEVSDTFRPTSMVETGNGEASLYCYLDALEGAYAHYVENVGPIDIDTHFDWNIYHVPFGGITFQAHRTLLRHWKRLKKSEVMEHFRRKTLPSLRYNSRLGATYSGSTFIALMGLVASCDELRPGQRVGIYAYGSGSCGELYSGLVGPRAREVVAAAELDRLIDERQPLTVEAYETLEQHRFDLIDQGTYEIAQAGHDDLFDRRYAGRRLLVLRGNEDHFRQYDWS